MVTHKRSTLAVILALSAGAAPGSALARVLPDDAPGWSDAQARAVTTQVVRAPGQGGFDWGDAGIGAAGGFGLAMLGVGGSLLAGGRRPIRRPRGA